MYEMKLLGEGLNYIITNDSTDVKTGIFVYYIKDLSKSVLNFKNGTIVQYYIWLYYEYLSKIEDNLFNVGIQGILGQIKNIFPPDFFEENGKNQNFQKEKRIRETRPFYGKYK